MDHYATSEVTEERLEWTLQTMAAVVIDHYGDAYWPVFEALKRVLDEKRARRCERQIPASERCRTVTGSYQRTRYQNFIQSLTLTYARLAQSCLPGRGAQI